MTIPQLSSEACPGLAPGVRLTFDKARDRWVVLAPERVLVPDETALEILQRCDGTKHLDDIVDELATAYSADRSEIEHDVKDLLASLIEKRILTA
ncbi:MAG TPA: pyrroloquinoline quinone biosynthesis peptide chaperone PqqD [Dongiaceae bacterium]|jgi:pyrroloquinoline quinone biosynthesis protein D|nr:pyrroloquinoline quinone biosynthesis peptide chaperone PqqD [Dongiaceae bacterium]